MQPDKLAWIHWHHFLSNKAMKVVDDDSFSWRFKKELDKLWLDLEDDWNVWFVINHSWSHWNNYHTIMTEWLLDIMLEVNWNSIRFKELFEDFKLKILEDPRPNWLNVDYYLKQ